MKRSTVSFARLSRAVICVGVVLAAFATFGRTAAHAGTVYTISNSLSGASVQNGWTVAGTIELQDNTMFGAITQSGIKSWEWTATNPDSNISYSVNSATSNADTIVSGLITATATGLYAGDDFNPSIFGLGDGTRYLLYEKFKGNSAVRLLDYDSPSATKFYVNPMDFPYDGAYGFQFAATSNQPSPPPSSVPEIDPASFGSVAAFLTGAFGLIEQRRRRRGTSIALTA